MLKRKGLYVALGTAGALVILLGTVGMAYAQGPQPPVEGHRFFGEGLRGFGRQMGGRWGWEMRGFSLVDATVEATGLAAEDIIAALKSNEDAWEFFRTTSPSYQRIRAAYVDVARDRPGEFEKRLDHLVERSVNGKQFGYHIEDLY